MIVVGLVLAYSATLLLPQSAVIRAINTYALTHVLPNPSALYKRLLSDSSRFLQWWDTQQRVGFISGLPYGLILVCTLLYSTNWYIHVPQSIGGAKPRCASLDVLTAKLAPETLTALGCRLGAATPASTLGQVARTTRVDVLFMGTQTLVFRVPASKQTRDLWFELPRSALAGVQWCRDGA